jgi:ABC-type phosphate transport system ATPase subunit
MITTLTMNSMIGTIVNTKNYTAQLAEDGFGKTTFLDSVNTMLKMKQLTSKT